VQLWAASNGRLTFGCFLIWDSQWSGYNKQLYLHGLAQGDSAFTCSAVVEDIQTLLYGIRFATDCRRSNRSAAAEAHLDFIAADQDGNYACTIRETHDLLNDLGVVFGADLLVGYTTLL